MLDVIGVGLGPFNLSLAALLDELSNEEKIEARFFEREPEFNWHKGMILPHTTLQVPFMADLVTLIDPTSCYSFLNYLHHQHRLLKFYFIENFKIPREEYNHYCQWVADQLSTLRFDSEVLDIQFNQYQDGFIVTVLEFGKYVSYKARNIVIGTGTYPNLPPSLQKIAEQEPSRCMHSAQFRNNFDLNKLSRTQSKEDKQVPRVLVLGSGQSSAEVYRELFDKQMDSDGVINYQLDWITRSTGFFPMEYSPLGLEHFSPDYIDYFYHLEDISKHNVLKQQGLLYKGMGFSTIQDIYTRLYERTIANRPQYSTLISNASLEKVTVDDDRFKVTFRHNQQKQEFSEQYDYIIAGTGYQHRLPNCMSSILDHVSINDLGQPNIDREYRLEYCGGNEKAGYIFVQNQELNTHGVGTPDLGLGAYRSAMIINQLIGRNKYDTDALSVFQNFGV